MPMLFLRAVSQAMKASGFSSLSPTAWAQGAEARSGTQALTLKGRCMVNHDAVGQSHGAYPLKRQRRGRRNGPGPGLSGRRSPPSSRPSSWNPVPRCPPVSLRIGLGSWRPGAGLPGPRRRKWDDEPWPGRPLRNGSRASMPVAAVTGAGSPKAGSKIGEIPPLGQEFRVEDNFFEVGLVHVGNDRTAAPPRFPFPRWWAWPPSKGNFHTQRATRRVSHPHNRTGSPDGSPSKRWPC